MAGEDPHRVRGRIVTARNRAGATPDGARPAVIPVDLAIFGFLNAYVLRGERTIVVDTGYEFSNGRLVGALRRLGIGRGDVSLILLTHGHLDHLGGARRLRETLDAPIALHRLDAEIARTGKDRPLVATSVLTRMFLPFMPRRTPAFDPDVVHDGELDLAPYGVSGHTIATPGHTPGSISVVLEDCVIAGDLVAGGFIRGRSPRMPYFADDLGALRASVGRAVAVAHGPLYVGHRGPLDPAAVLAWRDRTRF